jgi:hypothetical protein
MSLAPQRCGVEWDRRRCFSPQQLRRRWMHNSLKMLRLRYHRKSFPCCLLRLRPPSAECCGGGRTRELKQHFDNRRGGRANQRGKRPADQILYWRTVMEGQRMRDGVSRRGLLRGLLAAVFGFVAPKPQARAGATRRFSYADGPPSKTRISRYDASGRLVFTS